MKVKLTVKRITAKTIDTKYGKKKKYGVLCEGEKGEEWISAWEGSPVEGWKEGQVVEEEIKSRQYQGKTYWDFVFPKNTKPQQGSEDLEEIKNMLSQIMTEVLEIKKKLESEPDNSEVPF